MCAEFARIMDYIMRSFRSGKSIYRVSLLLFILAGATGALFRFGEMAGFWFGLNPSHIRHAHSHLMFFAWAVPFPAALLLVEMEKHGGGSPLARWIPWLLFLTAFATYPLFLIYGYDPVELGSKRVPLSVVFSSINMLVWYLFIILYIRGRKFLSANLARSFSDMAVLFLFLSTLGAWGLAAVKILKVPSEFLSQALMHVFVNYFAEGWVVPVLFALLLRRAEGRSGTRIDSDRISLFAIAAGLSLVFIEGVPKMILPPGFDFLRGAGALLLASGMLYQAVQYLLHADPEIRRAVSFPVIFLILKYSGLFLSVLVPSLPWDGFRILYIHIMLLGFASSALVYLGETVDVSNPEKIFRISLFQAAVGLMVLTLVPITPVWPASWGGHWTSVGLFLGALLPVGMALFLICGGKEYDKSCAILRVFR